MAVLIITEIRTLIDTTNRVGSMFHDVNTSRPFLTPLPPIRVWRQKKLLALKQSRLAIPPHQAFAHSWRSNGGEKCFFFASCTKLSFRSHEIKKHDTKLIKADIFSADVVHGLTVAQKSDIKPM